LLVAVVLGVLLSAVSPRLAGTAQRLRLEQAGVELAQLLRAAHEHAVAGGVTMVWRWDEQARRAQVSGAADPAPAAQSRPLPPALSVAVSRAGAPVECACARFAADGTSEPVTVTVSLPPDALTLAVDETTSRVRLSPGPAAH
jgi:type II secretory pathway pseudopilin PulG